MIRRIGFGQLLAKSFDQAFVSAPTGQVRPFVRIRFMIIQFLRSILHTQIPEPLGSQGMVVFGIGGQNRKSPSFFDWFIQQRNQAHSLIIEVLGQSAELKSRWIKINQTHGFRTTSSSDRGKIRLRTCGNDHQGNAGRFLPEAMLADSVLFAEMVSMITEQYDCGIPGVRSLIQSFDHPTNLMVHKSYAGEVGPNAFSELLILVPAKKFEIGILG